MQPGTLVSGCSHSRSFPYFVHAYPQVPSQDDLKAAEDAVRTQADAVRALKVREGLSNQVAALGNACHFLPEFNLSPPSLLCFLSSFFEPASLLHVDALFASPEFSV